jgi:ketosteroid isomerase-like protein
MKICPKCQNKYTDMTLQYCLQDGTPLIGNESDSDSNPTVSLEETETVVSNRQSEKIAFDLSTSDERDWNESEETKVSSITNEPKSSKTLIAVVVTVFVMLLIFGFVGIGAFFYIKDTNDRIAQNKNKTIDKGNRLTKGNIDPAKNSPEPSPEKSPVTKPSPEKTKTPAPTPEETPETNPDQIKTEIAQKIAGWRSLAESRNLSAYMNFYASKLDYYTKRGVSRDFVRRDKQQAFNKYKTIKIQMSKMDIMPSTDGETAVATFDKQWLFVNDSEQNSGKVRSQLKFKKSGGRWLIISEKDLKVYYVNK